MTYQILDIPGQTTKFDDCPDVIVKGGGKTSMSVTIRYVASYLSEDLSNEIGEIAFSDVLEFRWIENDAAYEAYPQHEDDYELGLIEILDSAYIETMAACGGGRNHPGTRIRSQPESMVRHFRMGFDEWGTLDVIATQVTMSSTRGRA